MIRSTVFALCLAVTALASAAQAATYRFDVTDPDSTLGGQPFSPYYFFLDSSPTPVSSTTTSFTLDGTTYGATFSPVAVIDSYTFYNGPNASSPSFGGFDDYENVYEGDQLFTGSTSAPTFKLGTFALDNFGSGATLTISAVGAAVPEPAAWALMIGGFGLIGGALRRTAKERPRVSWAGRRFRRRADTRTT